MRHISTSDRPKSLLGAARASLLDYNRRAALKRLLGPNAGATSVENLDRLAALEARVNDHRRAGSAGYLPARHVELLVAMLYESRLAHG